MGKRVLLMYISNNSGHHRACLAIECALHILDKGVETKSINAFHYTNPILEKIINKTYMTVIKNRPEVWEYLYDNPVIVRKTQRLKDSIHRLNSGKMKTLLDNFKTDVVVCTQAFPCGMIADLKRRHSLDMPLVAILTDYAPHSYWIYKDVDAYIVPSQETGRRLIENGVSEGKIKPLGIPVDPKFYAKKDKAEIFDKYSLKVNVPVILIMGGGQGLGPIKKLVSSLDKSALRMQLIIVTGTNKRLYRYLLKKKRILKKDVLIFPFSDKIDEFMEIATLIITKPGGLTTAEAMAKGLPMIIVNPLPGQEAMNTRFLLDKRLAVKADDERETVVLLEELLNDPERLNNIKRLIKEYALQEASLKVAHLILEMA